MSIKANIKVSPDLSFQVEGEDEVGLFKSISRIQEIFGHTQCGQCKSTNIKYVSRKASKKSEWLELVCQEFKCRAKLSFGQTEETNLVYPKTRFTNLSEKIQEERTECQTYADAHDGWLPKGGWFIFKSKDKS